MLGTKSFTSSITITEYGKFKVVYCEAFNSYKVKYGDLEVPDHAAEGIEHIDYLSEILKARCEFAGINEASLEIDKGMSRFRISNYCQERIAKKKEPKTKSFKGGFGL